VGMTTLTNHTLTLIISDRKSIVGTVHVLFSATVGRSLQGSVAISQNLDGSS